MASLARMRYDSEPMESEPASVPRRIGRAQPVPILWWRAWRLRCPACGEAPIFRGWFAMHRACGSCGRLFNRDPGYLLGSIYFNYGITAVLVIVMYFTMYFRDWLSDTERLVVLSLFAIVFPMWFFRYARALWMAFDERWDPWPNAEEARIQNPSSGRSPGLGPTDSGL
jgi:uncharacterized protein (DUF983 family)